MIKKEEITLENIYAFFEGWLRWILWVNPKVRKLLMRNHIIEQIQYRMNSINSECYKNGSCIHCGCMIPQLLMSSKSCGGDCYPTLKNKKNWKTILEEDMIIRKKDLTTFWHLNKTKKIFLKRRIYDLDRNLQGPRNSKRKRQPDNNI
jgi:hypothetical protein